MSKQKSAIKTFNFWEPFEVYVSGKKVEDVFSLNITLNRLDMEKGEHSHLGAPQMNYATLWHVKNESERSMSVPLSEVSFGQR